MSSQLFVVVVLSFFYRVRFAEVIVLLGFFGQQAVKLVNEVNFLFRKILGVDEAVAGTFGGRQ